MTHDNESLADYQRRRWLRPNAHLYMRHDAWRFAPPGSGAYRPNVVQWTGKRGRWNPEDDAIEDQQQRREALAYRRALLDLKADLVKLKSDLAFERFKRVYFRWAYAEDLRRKANFNPAQPRVPAGNPDGGQWTLVGGGLNDPRVISDASPDPIRPGAQYAQDNTRRRYSINLLEEEARGGHTIAKHVSKADEELLSVLRRNYYVGAFSYRFQDAEGSFMSAESANDFVNRVLENNRTTVDLVASGKIVEAKLDQRFGYMTGKEAFRPDVYSEPYMRNTYAVRVVIRHEPSSERGYRVLTAFPINQDPRKR